MTTHNEAYELFSTWAGNRWPSMTAGDWPTGSPVWQAASAAIRYLDAGCVPLPINETPHPEALARAFQEMETAGQIVGQTVDWNMRLYTYDPALRLASNWLAGLIMHQNARQLIMPWDTDATTSAPSSGAIAEAVRRGYRRAIAEVLVKVEGMKWK